MIKRLRRIAIAQQLPKAVLCNHLAIEYRILTVNSISKSICLGIYDIAMKKSKLFDLGGLIKNCTKPITVNIGANSTVVSNSIG